MYDFKEELPADKSEAFRCVPGIGKCGGMLILQEPTQDEVNK